MCMVYMCEIVNIYYSRLIITYQCLTKEQLSFTLYLGWMRPVRHKRKATEKIVDQCSQERRAYHSGGMGKHWGLSRIRESGEAKGKPY